MKEAKRLSVLEQVQKKQLTIGAAARELDLSPRQVKRLKKRYELDGEKGVLSRRRGLPNCRKFPKKIEDKAMEALRDPLYEGFGPTFAKEKLRCTLWMMQQAKSLQENFSQQRRQMVISTF